MVFSLIATIPGELQDHQAAGLRSESCFLPRRRSLSLWRIRRNKRHNAEETQTPKNASSGWRGAYGLLHLNQRTSITRTYRKVAIARNSMICPSIMLYRFILAHLVHRHFDGFPSKGHDPVDY